MLTDFFLRMVPTNIVAAAAQGQMLGLIFFSILFGYFMTKIKGQNAEILIGFWKGIFDTLIFLTQWLMRFAPIGVFGLVAKVAATTGVEAIQPLILFFLTVLSALAIHFFIILSRHRPHGLSQGDHHHSEYGPHAGCAAGFHH